VFLREIVEVPWLDAPYDERRKIKAEDAALSERDTEKVQDRLQDLGYVGKGNEF
jgi:hypothetical protein